METRQDAGSDQTIPDRHRTGRDRWRQNRKVLDVAHGPSLGGGADCNACEREEQERRKESTNRKRDEKGFAPGKVNAREMVAADETTPYVEDTHNLSITKMLVR